MIKLRDLLLMEEGIRDSINFERWFGNSKIVDSKGNPLVCSHTSDSEWTIFDMGKAKASSIWGKGIYLSMDVGDVWNGHLKNSYSYNNQFYVRSEFPLDITKPLDSESCGMVSKYIGRDCYDGAPLISMAKRDGSVVESAKNMGFDSIIHIGPGRPRNHIVLFYPNQIKSVNGNNGNFSLSDDDVRH